MTESISPCWAVYLSEEPNSWAPRELAHLTDREHTLQSDFAAVYRAVYSEKLY
mgnify:CR=1 FL=1|jgi:hypothetical protein